MLTGVYETLRSAGRALTLELGDVARVPERLAELQAAAATLAADPDATEKQRAAAQAALGARLGSASSCSTCRTWQRGATGRRSSNGARARLEQAAFDELAERDRELLQELLDLFATAYAEASSASRRSTSRTCSSSRATSCATTRRSAAAEQLRFRAIMVDEFQDTNRLQCDLIDLFGAGSPDAAAGFERDVFFVGDEFQSIYGFRHADVAVFRERRERAATRLPLTPNYRSGRRCSRPSTTSSAGSSVTATSR